MDRTFSIIKPDATKRNITGSINNVIESSGLRIIAQKRISHFSQTMIYDPFCGDPYEESKEVHALNIYD